MTDREMMKALKALPDGFHRQYGMRHLKAAMRLAKLGTAPRAEDDNRRAARAALNEARLRYA